MNDRPDHPHTQPVPPLGLTAAVEMVAAEIQPQLVACRQHIHRHPELSMQEFATTTYLADRLWSCGLVPRQTSRKIGLMCEVAHGRDDGWIVLRGDIDALPIQTDSIADYRSANADVMHACGHDAHATMVLGALMVVRRLAESGDLPWPVAVRGVFQPGEETSTGAPYMIREGALDGAAAALALHVDPTLPVGQCGTRPGVISAGCDSFEAIFEGRGGHSARPHLTSDVIAAAATWINQVLQRQHRSHDCREPAVIGLGFVSGGDAFNVIPSRVRVGGTLRSLSQSSRRASRAAMEASADAVAMIHACKASVTFPTETPPVVNQPLLTRRLIEWLDALPSLEAVRVLEEPSMGAEDFAFFCDVLPGCLIRLGVAGPAVGHMPLHTPLFDIDEAALSVGAGVLALGAIMLCRPDGQPAL